MASIAHDGSVESVHEFCRLLKEYYEALEKRTIRIPSGGVYKVVFPRDLEKVWQNTQAEPAFVLKEGPLPVEQPAPLLDHLRCHLEIYFPKLYAQILEPTFADLREEHSTALAEGRPLKARLVLLQGCCALAAAAVLQLSYSLLGRIAALWQARSSK